MKKLLFITVLFCSFLGVSQESESSHMGFEITESSNLIWQKVYESDTSLEELLIYFKNNSFTSNLVLNGKKLSGKSGRSKIGESKTKLWRVFGAKVNFEASRAWKVYCTGSSRLRAIRKAKLPRLFL